MKSPAERPEVIVVRPRPGRLPKGLAWPLVIVLVATIGLTLRAVAPDWRGLWQEVGARAESALAAKPKAEPVALAKKADATPPAAKAKPADIPKAADAWAEIKRDADKAQAERDEAEKIKEKAAEDLAKSPPPPSLHRGRRGVDPALIAELQRRQVEAMRRMQAEMGDPGRMFERMERLQAEMQRRAMQDFARARPRGFGNLPPGFGGFGPPLPGMDRFAAPLPGQPQSHEDSGEEVRDGVRRAWRTRVIVIGG